MPAPKGNRNAIGNRGGKGRDPIYDPDMHPEKARDIALLGATNAEIAGILGVGESTVERWTREHVEFGDALRLGRIEADARIAERLYQRGIGYSHSEEKIFCNSEGVVTRVKTRKHYPPDVGACLRWLAVRRPDPWARAETRRHEVAVGGGVRGESRQEIINSILNLVRPKPDPT